MTGSIDRKQLELSYRRVGHRINAQSGVANSEMHLPTVLRSSAVKISLKIIDYREFP